MPAWRRLKDQGATLIVSAGGAGVLVAILLIFFYLAYEVVPLFGSASMEQEAQFDAPAGYQYLALEEQGELAFAIHNDALGRFFATADGGLIDEIDLSALGRSDLVTVVEDSPESRLLGLGFAGGELVLVQHQYRLSYPEDVRVITPRLDFPYGREPLQLDLSTATLVQLALRDSEEALLVAALDADNTLRLKRWRKQENFLSGEVELEKETLLLPAALGELSGLYLSVDQRWLIELAVDGQYRLWGLADLEDGDEAVLADRGQLFLPGTGISASNWLLGGISLLAGSQQGELAQFFVVRNEGGASLQRVRDFDTAGAVVVALAPEHRRKGFLALDDAGAIGVFHSTADRKLLQQSVLEAGAGISAVMAISPRADSLLVMARDGASSLWQISNEHPEISWSALWEKVWYESYPEPDYIWQSSASSNDFEPKYSFSPLAFGTLKAAFYAMLIGAPLAICGAIYTAYFMAPGLRRKVKPLIELMEALPTVILGFLAGLWLAPFIESNLTGVFTLMLLLPVGVLLFAFAWSRMPLTIRAAVPAGWDALILIPVVFLLGYLSFALNDAIELWLFGGDMRAWITNDLGISFDQRNALVVGIAMGLAVIPTVFSISEDAIFSVPRHLSYGSLALGATPWQTLVGVVMPTASPGIFSGLMIGMGRAVGETMIVLMATGNTPIMDANIFEGMRTLAANIAVEVPEAEVDSTHYRVLFLAAFVLFMFTFVVNTVAEIIRQRLRIKYGSL